MGIDERSIQACMPKQLLQRNDIPVLHLEDRREGMPRSFATDVLLDARLATYLLQHAVNFLVRRQARDENPLFTAIPIEADQLLR